MLCGDREFQKETIRNAIIFLASGEYRTIENLIEENFRANDELQNRYKDVSDYQRDLPLPNKLSALIYLATGTGKSYLIYGIAQIALGLGLVDKVLVLCPSLTIESGLKEKFEKLSGDDKIKATLPDNAVFKNPRIIDANSTIKNSDNGMIDILKDIIANENLPRSASKEVNHYCFKTPVNVTLTKLEPERKFVGTLANSYLCEKLDAWIKSCDMGFYSVEYSWRKGEHTTQGSFNPDFFLKIGDNIVVVEIKSNGDDSEENKAKYRWAKKHFEDLNTELKNAKIKQKYFFHFLSPASYSEFTQYLIDGRLFRGEFKSELEDLLEK